MALGGGGKCPKFSKNKVIIWDDFQSKVISELKFTSTIKNVKLKKDRIIVVCEKRIFIFNLQTYENIDILDTIENQRGLIAVNIDPDQTVIAFPSIFLILIYPYPSHHHLNSQTTWLIRASFVFSVIGVMVGQSMNN